jgi:hypothetical protein
MHSALADRESLDAVFDFIFFRFHVPLSDSTVSNDWPHSLHLNKSLDGTKLYQRQN